MTGSKTNKFGRMLNPETESLDTITRLASVFANRAAGTKESQRLKNKALAIERESVITQYLNGKTINQIASQNALTREFVRNAITEYNNRPVSDPAKEFPISTEEKSIVTERFQKEIEEVTERLPE